MPVVKGATVGATETVEGGLALTMVELSVVAVCLPYIDDRMVGGPLVKIGTAEVLLEDTMVDKTVTEVMIMGFVCKGQGDEVPIQVEIVM